jgi:hypothetical protein
VRRAWKAWDDWAFGPIDAAPMAALRIVVGLLTIGWTLSLLPDARTFLGARGLQRGLPHYDSGAWVIDLGPPYLSLSVLLAAAVALTVGWRTRVASVVVAVLLLAVQRRDPWVLNSGDLLLRELAFFVMLMPAGETWSLDARRRGRERLRAPWALRLVQLQISALYLFSVWAKVSGVTWNNGTAVGIALQLEDLQRFALPAALSTSVLVSALLTYSSLLVEASLAVCLWLPRLRYPAMVAGIGLHLGIEAALLIGWFSLAVISSYVAFVPAADLRRVVERFTARAAAPRSARDPGPLRSS